LMNIGYEAISLVWQTSEIDKPATLTA